MNNATIEDRAHDESFHEEYLFGNVHLRVHPNGKVNAWRVYNNFSNVLSRIIIDGRISTITCPKGNNCHGITYNEGLLKYLCCGNHMQCPTENPDVCAHENYAEPGRRAKFYPNQIKESQDYA